MQEKGDRLFEITRGLTFAKGLKGWGKGSALAEGLA